MKQFFTLKNFRLKTVILFSIFALILFIVDWATKHFLFDPKNIDWNNNGGYVPNSEVDHRIIGVRSVAHDNSTIFSALKIRINDWVSILINLSIALVFCIIPFFTKKLFLGVACGVIFSGIMGNTLDKAFSAHEIYSGANKLGRTFVRDIFYLPWLDRGTFNFADVAIIFGSGLVMIHIIISNVKDIKENKNKKNDLNNIDIKNLDVNAIKTKESKVNKQNITKKTINNNIKSK